MCESISNMSNDVTLIAKQNSNKNSLNDFDYYGVEKNFKIIKIFFLNIRGLGEIFYAIKNFFLCLSISPELIYSRHSYSTLLTSFLGKKYIHEDHTVPSFFHRSMLKIAFRNKPHKIVLISESLKNDYKKYFPKISDKNFIVSHDGAEINKNFSKDENFYKKIGKKINIGYVGHLYTGKGMEIIDELSKNVPSVDFHVVGGLEQDIEYWKSKCTQKNIFFHGFYPRKKIPNIIQCFDIMIAPFKSKILLSDKKIDIGRWTSPLKIFEYMAARKPIISSKIVSVKEVLTHRETALLVDPEKIEEWCTSLDELITSESLRIEIAKNAYDLFMKKYTWAKRAENIIN